MGSGYHASLLIVITLLASCARPGTLVATSTIELTPAATLSPTGTTTQATPAPPTPVPNPLAASLEALRHAGSFRTMETFHPPSPSPWPMAATEIETRHVLGPPEASQSFTTWTGGSAEENICLGAATSHRCWSRVGSHPWVEQLGADAQPTWLEQEEQLLAHATITSTETLTGTGQIVVDWHVPPMVPWGGLDLYGRTWLDQSTYLPQREVVEERGIGGVLVSNGERVYDSYGGLGLIQMPAVATVTPVPTVPVAARTPLPVRQEVTPAGDTLYLPAGPGPFPAVIVLHGSEGGTTYTAPLALSFARDGFAALALCYFGCPGRPDALKDIPVEGVMAAVDYLRARADVRPGAVALVGLSRGAELALIVGVLDPNVRAVVSVMGSPFVNPGQTSAGLANAWLYGGQQLAFATIPVEQINGPVLLIQGQLDKVWPVDFAYQLADRLAAQGHAYELAVYPNRGHDIGSTPVDAFERIVDFLRRTQP
jgi:dienelactone hydrolase